MSAVDKCIYCIYSSPNLYTYTICLLYDVNPRCRGIVTEWLYPSISHFNSPNTENENPHWTRFHFPPDQTLRPMAIHHERLTYACTYAHGPVNKCRPQLMKTVRVDSSAAAQRVSQFQIKFVYIKHTPPHYTDNRCWLLFGSSLNNRIISTEGKCMNNLLVWNWWYICRGKKPFNSIPVSIYKDVRNTPTNN